MDSEEVDVKEGPVDDGADIPPDVVDFPDQEKEPVRSEDAGDKTEAEAPQTQEEEAQEVAPPSLQIPIQLHHRAFAVGLEADEIAEHTSAAELERTVKALERRIVHAQNTDSSRGQPAKTDAKRMKLEDISDFTDEHGIDKEITSRFGGLKGYIAQQDQMIAELRQELSETRNGWNSFQMERQIEAFDNALHELGQKDLFGEGSGYDLEDTSPMKINRAKVWSAMNDIVASKSRRNEKLPSKKELVKQAYRMVFGDKIVSDTRKDIGKTLKRNAAGRFTSPPTSRETQSSKTAEQMAIAALRKKGLE